MNRDRIAYAVLMAAVAALTALASADALSPKVSLGVVAGIAGINGLLRVLWPPKEPPTVGTGDR